MRADEARAHKRFRWAQETFQWLRNGGDPATIIDPETTPTTRPRGARRTRSSGIGVPRAPPPDNFGATGVFTGISTRDSAASASGGCSEEDGEMIRVAAELIGSRFRPPGAAQPPTDEPGPPLA